jgi:cyclopropane fatty-acyl-phospholipid synthase-like methyltransferase
VQAQLARESAEQLGLQDHILFAEGDFTSVPIASEWDAVYSVEAVCHAMEPEQYFREAGRLLRRGGRLILVDDYLAARSLSQPETKWINAFIDGWHVPGVRTVEQVTTWAEKYSLRLVTNDELTPHLRLRNLPDLLARAILFIGNHLPIKHAILPSMLGSMALQQCCTWGSLNIAF